MPDPFAAWLDEVPDSESSLAAAVIAFVRTTVDEVAETMKWNNPCFVVDGSNCLYVAAQDGYVNLGFYEGAHLEDPTDLLEGTGKSMRHVKIRSAAALEDPELAELVSGAVAHAREE